MCVVLLLFVLVGVVFGLEALGESSDSDSTHDHFHVSIHFLPNKRWSIGISYKKLYIYIYIYEL